MPTSRNPRDVLVVSGRDGAGRAKGERGGPMGQALPVMADETLDTRVATDTPEAAPGRDLRSLVEAYERRLIVNALGAAGGRQNRAAALLGMLPTTLCEK